MINYRKYYLPIFIVVLVIAYYIAWQFDYYSSKEAITALIDVTLTTIALVIAILEILMVRSISDESRIAVTSALNRITEIFSIADIAKGIRMAYDIQKYIQGDEFFVAHIRMQDLKSIIIPLKNDKKFQDIEFSSKLSEALLTLSVDINNLNLLLNGSKPKQIDKVKMNLNLENLVTILTEYDNYIKTL